MASRLEARRTEGVVRDKGRKARIIEAIATRVRGCYGGISVVGKRVEGKRKKNVKGVKSQGKQREPRLSAALRIRGERTSGADPK